MNPDPGPAILALFLVLAVLAVVAGIGWILDRNRK